MRRFLTAIIIAAVALTGCGGGSKTDVVPHDAAETILNGVTFRDSLIEAQGNVAEEWYSLDGKVTDFAIYVSGSGATAEEIAVIKSGDIKSAKAAVESRVEDLKFRFENYVPAEMTKLNDPVIVSKGDTVILILADDSGSAQKIAESILK